MAARIMRVAATIRNHWKKSLLGAVLAGWGVHFVQDRFRANLLREEFCKKAVTYGQQPVKSAIEKPRKVTVILNPAARNGKGRKLFEKNAAPLLHLAGIDVEILKTESEGNAKEKSHHLDTTDAVVVAGGDGTVGEVVTGLLRREDEASVSLRWPLGIIPVGSTNSLARFLYANAESDVRWMGNAAMAVIRGVTEPVDVMAIQGEDGRQVFTVNNLQWGSLQDAKEQSPKYWYFGPLKWRLTYVFAGLKSVWPPILKATIKHSPPFEEPEPREMGSTSSSWWAWLRSLIMWTSNSAKNVTEEKEDSTVAAADSKEMEWSEDDVLTTELVVTTGNTDEVKMTPRALRLTTGPAELTRTEFIKEGWRRLRGPDSNGVNSTNQYKIQTAEVGAIKITPALKEGEEAWYTVDNEKLEVQPITVRILPRKLQFFTNRQDRDTVIGASQS